MIMGGADFNDDGRTKGGFFISEAEGNGEEAFGTRGGFGL